MSKDILKVPKLKTQVSLWVHPEGQVMGSLFVREHSPDHAGKEEPVEVLNSAQPFVVLEKENKELRFYNRNCLVRVEYSVESSAETTTRMDCQINMMDGSFIEGSIRENLPPEYSRLFDYLNRDNERFIKVHISDNDICLINKSYINNVTSIDS